MKQVKYVVIFCILIFITSCSTEEKEDVTLTLRNENISVYCPKGNCNYFREIDYLHYPDKAKNIVSLEIENHSEHTYVLMANCGLFGNMGCYMPSSNRMMSISNLEFEDVNRKNIPVENSGIHVYRTRISYKDSISADFYKKMGYPIKYDMDKFIFDKARNSLLIIPPQQTIFVESLIYLPFNISEGNQGVIDLNIDQEYEVRAVINSDSTNKSQYLPREFIKTSTENKYRFYKGFLRSNFVKVKFIK